MNLLSKGRCYHSTSQLVPCREVPLYQPVPCREVLPLSPPIQFRGHVILSCDLVVPLPPSLSLHASGRRPPVPPPLPRLSRRARRAHRGLRVGTGGDLCHAGMDWGQTRWNGSKTGTRYGTKWGIEYIPECPVVWNGVLNTYPNARWYGMGY